MDAATLKTYEEFQTEGRKQKGAEMAAGLRELADFLEQNQEIPIPYISALIFTYDKKEFISNVKSLVSGGHIRKVTDDGDYKAIRDFGPVAFKVSIPRTSICRLVTPAVYECPELLDDSEMVADGEVAKEI